MRGFDHPMARLLSANADFLGDATCRGRLYLVKHYPGLVLSDDPADIVFGELYRLRERDAMLREFDMYEACGEGFAQPTEYLRQMLQVALDDGAASEAWTYVYNWPVTKLCRGSPRARFLAELGPLLRLRLLLHVGTQHRIDAALIAFALALEEVEHVFVDANGDRLLPRRYHQNGVRPVDVDRHRIGIVGDGLGDVLVRQGVEARPVSLALPRGVP